MTNLNATNGVASAADVFFQAQISPQKPVAVAASSGLASTNDTPFDVNEIVLQVLSLRKNDLQWLPPDAAKMKCIQQLIVTGFVVHAFVQRLQLYMTRAADNPFTALPPALLLRLKGEGSRVIQFTFETTLPGMWGLDGSMAGRVETTHVGVGAGVLGLRELMMSQTYAGQTKLRLQV